MLKLKKNYRLVFAGDSVTDAGRVQPVAEGLFDPFGNGYPRIVNGFLTASYPELMIRVTNMGTSGNTSRDLLNRWETEILPLKPDFLSVMIGVNDVWRQFDTPQIPENSVGIEEYERNLEAMILSGLKVVKKGCFALITPHYVEPNRNDAMRKQIDCYGEVCRKLAEKYNLIFVDTQSEFDKMLKHCHPNYITWDRVHPNFPGHTVIAKAFLRAIGFDFSR